MSTQIHVTDSTGHPIDNASIECGGCAVTNGGSGFYSVDVDLTPTSGGFAVVAPLKMPVVYNWFVNLFSGGNVVLPDATSDGGKW